LRIKLDRTVCDGFGTCAVRAPNAFSLDEWGYPTLTGNGDIDAADDDDVMRALLDCPAHAIVAIDEHSPIPAGGEAAAARSTGPDALWRSDDEIDSTMRRAMRR
jgi:ferredoxin